MNRSIEALREEIAQTDLSSTRIKRLIERLRKREERDNLRTRPGENPVADLHDAAHFASLFAVGYLVIGLVVILAWPHVAYAADKVRESTVGGWLYAGLSSILCSPRSTENQGEVL